MWCIVISSTCSCSPSFTRRPRISGPCSKSNAARASASACKPSWCSDASSVLRSTHSSVSPTSAGTMSCTACPSCTSKRVRNASCRATIRSSARRNASSSSSPFSRRPTGMWYASLPPSICARNHNRCCANDSGSGSPRSATVIAGSAVPCPRTIACATALRLGWANSSVSPSSAPSCVRTCATSRTACSEWPPSVKKSSWRPTRSTPNSVCQMPARATSTSPCGAS
ncbi:hypothetical protein GO281_04847 [Ralstonia solanacearum]|nr:hypothetical protein [Ralstonia solanacearum]NKA51244.1 hypothetical protein [Ralstonia solanacearum]NKA61058.1 hypothetical protein [Ralstonia solanacearum]